MRAKMKLLTTVAGAGLLLAGCCAPHHLTKWEYKVAIPAREQGVHTPEKWIEARQQLLNDLGKDGWILVSEEQGGVFYLKRPLR
jgi:hypothetical protein